MVAFDVPHKGGRTFGYRVSDGQLVDRVHPRPSAREPDTTPAIVRECEGVDLLVHDSQFLERERVVADLYGHATVDDSLDLAVRCGARRLVLFHHSPARRDDEVDAIGQAAVESGVARGVEVIVAREEDLIDLGTVS